MSPKLFPLSFGFAPRLAFFYAALFLLVGIQLPFFPLWLQAKGLEAQAIGIVLALPMVVRLFAVPAASWIVEKDGALRGTLIAAAVATTLGYLLVGFADSFATIALLYALATAAAAPIHPLAETYALKGLGERRRAYGPVRLWGSVAFIGGTLFAGYAIDVFAARDLIWMIVGAVALCAVSAVTLEPVGAPPPSEMTLSRWQVLRDPAFLAVIGGASLIQSSHALYYGFGALAWVQAGFDSKLIAILWAVGTVPEIVLFAVQGRLPAALTPLRLVMIGGLAAVVRWLAMAANPPLAVLPLLQILHGLSFGATHIGALGYISRAIPQNRAASAQGAFSVVLGLTMAGMTGLSGWLYAAYGNLSYAAMALAAVAGCACGAIAHHARQRAML
jgi:PPP family 3-phenylpropionic acid transporter